VPGDLRVGGARDMRQISIEYNGALNLSTPVEDLGSLFTLNMVSS
jgi:hypothetical protein